MTKLVKTSGDVEGADEFSKALSEALDARTLANRATDEGVPPDACCEQGVRFSNETGGHPQDHPGDCAGPFAGAVEVEDSDGTRHYIYPVARGSQPRAFRRLRNPVVIDTETSPWDSKTDAERQRRKAQAFNFGVSAGMSAAQMAKLVKLTPEEVAKLKEQFDRTFPEMKEFRARVEARAAGLTDKERVMLDMMTVDGMTVVGGSIVKVDEVDVRPPDTTIANVVDGNFTKMRREISADWQRRFDIEMPNLASAIAKSAIDNAKRLGVASNADTTVSECGCIWALQTTFNAGSGDVIIRTCAEHSPKQKMNRKSDD